MDTPVHVEQSDGVQIITINRPEVRNAINTETAVAIAAALEELDARDDLVAGVVTGAGKTFCTGMDLKAFLAGERPSVEGRGFAGITEKSSDKPIIAAVEGHAVAGGFEIVLACDLVVASETAVFGLPEVKRGLLAGGGGLLRLPRKVPHQLAVEWSLTGEYFTAHTAYEAKLLNRLVPRGRRWPRPSRWRRRSRRTARSRCAPPSRSSRRPGTGPTTRSSSACARSTNRCVPPPTRRKAHWRSRRSANRSGRDADRTRRGPGISPRAPSRIRAPHSDRMSHRVDPIDAM